MKTTLLLVSVLLSGCTIVSTATANRACSLLETATREADMPEAWFINAGPVLEQCGVADAKELADWKACHARRMNDSSEVCE